MKPDQKTCSGCAKTKPIHRFPKRGARCKRCIREYTARWRALSHGAPIRNPELRGPTAIRQAPRGVKEER